MTEERKVQLGVAVDATGAREGFNEVKREAQSMAQSVAQAGSQAGKAVDSIGNGGDASAKKVDAATKSMIQSIQRTTAVMEAGSKSSAKYYETLAAQRGVDVNALKPYLDQLDAVAAKQKQAEQALNSTNPALNKVGVSAAQTAAALRQVPAQFTDIIVSLQSGQQPLTVLLQQGGQLKDMFGGIGPAARALGGYVAGLLNPFTLAAAAAGALAVAYHEGSKEADAYSRALILSGNAAGTTAGQLADMAARVGKSVGTQGQAAEAIAALAATGRIAAGDLEYFTRVAVQMEKTVGQSVGNTAKDLAELGKAPLAASEQLNEKYHYLTAGVYAHIKSLQDQGKEEEAAAAAQKAFADALDGRTKEITSNLGTIERGWNSITSAIKGALDATKDFGRQQTPQQKVSSIGEQIGTYNPFSLFGPSLEELKQQQSYAQELVRLAQRGAEAEAANTQQNEARISWMKEGDKYMTRSVQLEREIAKAKNDGLAAGASEVEIQQRITDIRKKYSDIFNNGIDSQIEALKRRAAIEDVLSKRSLDQLATNRQLGLLGEQEYIEKVAQLELAQFETRRANLTAELALAAGKQNSLKEQAALSGELAKVEAERVSRHIKLTNDLLLLEERRKAIGRDTIAAQLDDDARAREEEDRKRLDRTNAALKLANDYGRTIDDNNRLTALEVSLLGQTEERRAVALEQARIQIDLEKQLLTLDALQLDSEEKKQRQEELRAAASRAMDGAAQRVWLDSWKRINDDVGRSLTDALINGGKSAGEYLRDYFRTLVLRPVIQAVMAPVSGAVASLFAPSTAMAGGTGGLGSTSSLLSAGKTLWDGFAGGFASFGNTAGQLSQFGLTSLSGGTAAVSTGMAGTGWVSAEGGTGFLNGGASSAGIAAGYAAGIGAGIGLGNLISGQYGSQFVTVAGTAAGAAIGAQIGAIGGPLGAAIGGVVGGLANRAFGMGPKQVQAFGIEGDFGSDSFMGRNFSDWKQKGGWFRSDKRGTNYSMLDPAVIDQFSGGVAALRAQTETFAQALGLSADAVAGYSKHIRLTLTNDQAENQKLITQLFGSIGDEMAGMVVDLSAFARAGETAGGTLQRLATSITTANNWLSHLQQTLFQASIAGGDAASKLADAFGGLDNLASVSAAFYQAYYTEGERAARSREDMKKALESVNLSMPESMAQLRQMAGALDLTTESGRNAYVTLLSIAPEFANVAQATERAAKETAGKLLAAFSVRGALVPALAGTQQATDMLNGEIYALGKSAGDATLDIAGLGEALANVNTETFVETMAQVFENLASRIRNVIGDIASERGAVREAALQIMNPAGMSVEAIRAGIAGINTALPSNAGFAGLGADYARIQQLTAAQSAALAPYRAAQDALSNFRDATAPSSLERAQLVRMNGNVPAVNEDLYASNSAYRQAWDSLLAEHTNRFGTGYTSKSEAGVVNQQLLDRLAPAIAAEKAAFNQSMQDQMRTIDALQATYKNATDALASAQATAAEHAKEAQLSYADALQQFAIEAGQSVNKLSHLREETLKYYEAQKQLADLMTNSAAGLRKSLTDYRYNQLSPEDQFSVLRSQFASAYSMSLSTDGETLAGYADKLNGLINPLLDKAREVYGDGADYNAVFSAVFAQAQSIASRLETLTPTNYAADSLQLLTQIDASLAALESASRSAEGLVVDAIDAARDQTVGGLRAVVAAITGQTIPAFATGGLHDGGVRLVGENGPELEVTGPSRIYSASQTRDLLGRGGNEELIAEVRALRQENADLHAALQAIATHTSNTARRLERFEQDGMVVRTEVDSPLKTEAVA